MLQKIGGHESEGLWKLFNIQLWTTDKCNEVAALQRWTAVFQCYACVVQGQGGWRNEVVVFPAATIDSYSAFPSSSHSSELHVAHSFQISKTFQPQLGLHLSCTSDESPIEVEMSC